MFKLIKSYWPNIKTFLVDLLKFKKKDILYKLLGVFLWLYVIRVIVTIIIFLLLVFF
jgi:hypothetical protein